MSTFKIGMIGDYETSIGFKAAGIDTYIAKVPAEAKAMLLALAKEGYGIVFVTEEIASLLEDTIDQVNRDTECAVLIIPSVKGSKGLGKERIKKSVERAVGIDIFKSSQ